MNDLKPQIRRLKGPDDADQAYCCMSETSTPWPQALCACRDWMSLNLGRHVEGYHMRIGDEIAGHLYYALSEQALFPYRLEDNVGVMYCEWVQPRYQKQGFGRLLYDTFQADMERAGVKGIVIEGNPDISMEAMTFVMDVGNSLGVYNIAFANASLGDSVHAPYEQLDTQRETIEVVVVDDTTYQVFGAEVSRENLEQALRKNISPDIVYHLVLKGRREQKYDAFAFAQNVGVRVGVERFGVYLGKEEE